MDNSSLVYNRIQVRHEVSIKKLVIRTGFNIGGVHECGRYSGSSAYKLPQFPSIVLELSYSGVSLLKLMGVEVYLLR